VLSLHLGAISRPIPKIVTTAAPLSVVEVLIEIMWPKLEQSQTSNSSWKEWVAANRKVLEMFVFPINANVCG